MSLGARIRELRLERGWTQNELAQRAGVSQPTISAYENNTDKDHKVEVLFGIAAALKASPDYLRTGEGPVNLSDVKGSLSEIHSELLDCSADEIGLAMSVLKTIKAQRKK